MGSEERKWVFISFLRRFIDSRPSRWILQEQSGAVGKISRIPMRLPRRKQGFTIIKSSGGDSGTGGHPYHAFSIGRTGDGMSGIVPVRSPKRVPR
jgi:hypothetical protein